mmetsp:Transcript_122228/g.390981  ORF Transcript_122228/g.390981 Transcript_122228/m.390981 type:complete len:407 (-) Transcript_122228:1177-2397(-)
MLACSAAEPGGSASNKATAGGATASPGSAAASAGTAATASSGSDAESAGTATTAGAGCTAGICGVGVGEAPGGGSRDPHSEQNLAEAALPKKPHTRHAVPASAVSPAFGSSAFCFSTFCSSTFSSSVGFGSSTFGGSTFCSSAFGASGTATSAAKPPGATPAAPLATPTSASAEGSVTTPPDSKGAAAASGAPSASAAGAAPTVGAAAGAATFEAGATDSRSSAPGGARTPRLASTLPSSLHSACDGEATKRATAAGTAEAKQAKSPHCSAARAVEPEKNGDAHARLATNSSDRLCSGGAALPLRGTTTMPRLALARAGTAGCDVAANGAAPGAVAGAASCEVAATAAGAAAEVVTGADTSEARAEASEAEEDISNAGGRVLTDVGGWAGAVACPPPAPEPTPLPG